MIVSVDPDRLLYTEGEARSLCVVDCGFCVLENRLEISARAKKELVPAFGNVTHLECGGTSSARYT